jgi:CheY-like chemotaxis protein
LPLFAEVSSTEYADAQRCDRRRSTDISLLPKDRAIGLGVQVYLLKPFDVEELQHVVESYFRTV